MIGRAPLIAVWLMLMYFPLYLFYFYLQIVQNPVNHCCISPLDSVCLEWPIVFYINLAVRSHSNCLTIKVIFQSTWRSTTDIIFSRNYCLS